MYMKTTLKIHGGVDAHYTAVYRGTTRSPCCIDTTVFFFSLCRRACGVPKTSNPNRARGRDWDFSFVICNDLLFHHNLISGNYLATFI